MPTDRLPESEPLEPIKYETDVFPTERTDTGGSRVHAHGSHVDRHVQTRRQRAHSGHQRPWYHPHPQPKRRMDVMGVNGWMWLLAVVLIVLLVLWY